MPKKTKKEKLRALHHREHTHAHGAGSTVTTPVSPSHVSTGYSYAFKANNMTQIESSPEQTHELVAITQDLRKTLLLAVLAVTAELLLYWQLVVKK